MKALVLFTNELNQSAGEVIRYFQQDKTEVIVLDLSRPAEINNLSPKLGQLLRSPRGHVVWNCRIGHPVASAVKKEQIISRYLHNELLHSVVWMLNERAYYVLGMPMLESLKLTKLYMLECALQAGLQVPAYHIAYQFADLEPYIGGNYVVKPFSDCISFEDDGVHYKNYTTDLSGFSMESLQQFTGPTFVQQKIEKVLDVKILYLDGCLLACGIADEGNNADYRTSAALSYLALQLPVVLSEKLRSCMKHMGINYGTIDLIYGRDGQYYFLECNPHGIFHDLSFNAGLHIEYHIYQHLKQKIHE